MILKNIVTSVRCGNVIVFLYEKSGLIFGDTYETTYKWYNTVNGFALKWSGQGRRDVGRDKNKGSLSISW